MLDNYADLQTAIGNLLNRTDLAAYIPDFISLCEAQLNRRLRVRQMLSVNAAFAINTEYVSLPADFAGARSLTLTSISPPYQLKFLSPERLNQNKHSFTQASQPEWYGIVGSNFHFVPAPDQAYTAELTYWQKIPPLATNSTNWLLTAHPDAYLYGSGVQAAAFLKNDQRLQSWGTLYQAALTDIERDEAMAAYGGPLNRRARTFG